MTDEHDPRFVPGPPDEGWQMPVWGILAIVAALCAWAFILGFLTGRWIGG